MARPLDIEDFPDQTLIGDLSISPSGDRVVYVADEFDPDEDERRESLFVVPTDGSDDPHRLSRASTATSPTFSPDGSKLAFLAAREEDGALRVGTEGEDDTDDESDGDDEDDEPKRQVWVFDLERGGDARQVTTREEGVREFDWAPDGERIVISARDPTDEEREYLDAREEDGPIEVERLQHKADGIGWLDSVTTYLFVVDVETREERKLEDAYGAGAYEPLGGLQPAWGRGGIAFLSNRTEEPDDSAVSDLYVIDPDGGDAERLTGSDLRVRAPRWGPDGERIAFVGGHPTNWYRPSEVYLADLEGGYESISADLDRTVAFFVGPRFLDDETLVCAFGDEGWTRLVRLHADGSPPERVFDRQEGYGTIGFLDLAGDTIALSLSHPREGHDVYALSASDLDGGGDPIRLSRTNADLLSGVALPEYRRVEYENGDGEGIEALVYYPEEFDPESPEPHPLIVKIHGGPMSYDAPDYRFDLTYWTGQGYIVLRPNYRGSSSYGREFCERLRGTRGDLEADDVVSGTAHLIEEGWVDPDRMFITGFSYGGITTANVLTRDDRFAAAAAEHGIYDNYSLFGTDDNHLWHEDEFGLPWENEKTYREISSITDVDRIETPLLITAGEEDWRCPPTQAEQLYVSVKKRGVPAKLIVYPDEHHNVDRPERAIHRLRELTEWFEAHDPVED